MRLGDKGEFVDVLTLGEQPFIPKTISVPVLQDAIATISGLHLEAKGVVSIGPPPPTPAHPRPPPPWPSDTVPGTPRLHTVT